MKKSDNHHRFHQGRVHTGAGYCRGVREEPQTAYFERQGSGHAVFRAKHPHPPQFRECRQPAGRTHHRFQRPGRYQRTERRVAARHHSDGKQLQRPYRYA